MFSGLDLTLLRTVFDLSSGVLLLLLLLLFSELETEINSSDGQRIGYTEYRNFSYRFVREQHDFVLYFPIVSTPEAQDATSTIRPEIKCKKLNYRFYFTNQNILPNVSIDSQDVHSVSLIS